MKAANEIRRRYYLWKYKGRLSIEQDTNLNARNLTIKNGGKVSFGEGVSVRDNVLFSCDSGELTVQQGCFFNRNALIVCHSRIVIGENLIFGPNVCIFDHDHAFTSNKGVEKNKFKCGEITIGKRCWIGANVVILRGSEIGDDCIVGAGVVLKGKFPSNSIITGFREYNVRSSTDFQS